MVVDQPTSVGALPLAVAQDMGCPVPCLPGLTMRWIYDLYPGEAKTDARDAFAIDDATRATPHTLTSIDCEDETIAELEMFVNLSGIVVGTTAFASEGGPSVRGAVVAVAAATARACRLRLLSLLGSRSLLEWGDSNDVDSGRSEAVRFSLRVLSGSWRMAYMPRIPAGLVWSKWARWLLDGRGCSRRGEWEPVGRIEREPLVIL